MQTECEVRQGDPPGITDVHVIYESPKMMVALVNTKPKRPEPELYIGGIGVQIKGGTQIRFTNLPMKPGRTQVFAVADRYCFYAFVFDTDLLEGLSFRNEGKTIYEAADEFTS